MLKFIWLLNNILLIFLILIRTPNNSGLESFTTKSNFLGSPNSAENFLNKLTWILIGSYFILAIKFNF
jgi:protein translocase SecG subunit